MRASESDRALDCPHSLIALGSKAVSDKAEDAREWGHMVHWWVETGKIVGRKGHVESFRKKLRLTGVDRHEWWKPGGGEHEVTFALHLTTLQLLVFDALDEESDRDDWKLQFPKHEWLTGTIDWLCWGDADTAPWVDDLKTGHWPVDARTSRQLLSYMLVPWVAMGCPLDEWRGVVSITQWEKYPLESQPQRRAHWVTGFDMLDHLESVRWAVGHPEEANVLDPVVDRRGWTVKMSPCAFCSNRMEHPASEWMTSWKFNRMPTCWEGVLSLLREGRLQRVEE